MVKIIERIDLLVAREEENGRRAGGCGLDLCYHFRAGNLLHQESRLLDASLPLNFISLWL